MKTLLANLKRIWAYPIVRQYGWYGLIAAAAIAYVETRLGVANDSPFVHRLRNVGVAITELFYPTEDTPPGIDEATGPELPPVVAPPASETPDQPSVRRKVPPISESLGIDSY